MSQAMAVKIGPSFFAKEKREYSNWRWAFAREAFQNSVDAPGATKFVADFRSEGEADIPVVCFENNGAPMDEVTLVDKLLAIGETGKGVPGAGSTIGGFGKAKLLLLFCQRSWSVRTGTLLAEGIGGSYELTRDLPYFHGTRTTVVLEKHSEGEEILGQFRRVISLSNWRGSATVAGELVTERLVARHHRLDKSWGSVRTGQSHPGLLVVRMGGVPMFCRGSAFKGVVVVELVGSSLERLTANRDGMVWSEQQELDELVTAIAVDKRSALRKEKAEYKRFQGERQRVAAKEAAERPLAMGEGLVAALLGDKLADVPNYGPSPLAGSFSSSVTVLGRSESAVSIGPEFVLKNCSGMVVPACYVPGPLFSAYSKGLVTGWARCLVALHEILGKQGNFSVGFIFDDEALAESERTAAYGQVYYLNPCKVVAQKDKPQCRSFARQFQGAWSDRFALISIALHEVIHGAYGLGKHDEDYSSALTEATGKVFPHLGRLSGLFRG